MRVLSICSMADSQLDLSRLRVVKNLGLPTEMEMVT